MFCAPRVLYFSLLNGYKKIQKCKLTVFPVTVSNKRWRHKPKKIYWNWNWNLPASCPELKSCAPAYVFCLVGVAQPNSVLMGASTGSGVGFRNSSHSKYLHWSSPYTQHQRLTSIFCSPSCHDSLVTPCTTTWQRQIIRIVSPDCTKFPKQLQFVRSFFTSWFHQTPNNYNSDIFCPDLAKFARSKLQFVRIEKFPPLTRRSHYK